MKKLNVEFQELPYAVEEAMNRLRINIKFCGKNTKKILITSSMPNEGKSSIAINLWKMLAEAGFPTVLVDVDLRKSVIKERHHINDTEKLQDLGYYLSGQAEIEDVVYETQVENAYIVPCMNLLENPSALLEDARFAEILDKLAKGGEYGEVLRAKGIVTPAEGEWFHFDLVPEETELRRGAADYTGRICVIGANLNEDKLKELFHV